MLINHINNPKWGYMLGLFIFLMPLELKAEDSAFLVRHSVFSMGGSIAAVNRSHQVSSTLGEVVVGETENEFMSFKHGFWSNRFLEAEFTLSDDYG